MKWFNQKAEIKRLEAENERLGYEVDSLNTDLYNADKKWNAMYETALKALAKNRALKNGIQECIDYETPKANATVRRITNKLRGLLS